MSYLSPDVISTADDLSGRLHAVLALPSSGHSPRIQVSHLATQLALEHCDACRTLLSVGMVPSGMVVLRAQYEATVRAIWALYAASDAQIEKLTAVRALDSEQSAKNLPLVADMMAALAVKAPPEAFDALSRFKDSAWKALNSYVHAGIHALQRQATGYPPVLVDQMFRISSGFSIVAGMQAAALTGVQQVMHEVSGLTSSHQACLPPRL